jgi:hypothetical protein
VEVVVGSVVDAAGISEDAVGAGGADELGVCGDGVGVEAELLGEAGEGCEVRAGDLGDLPGACGVEVVDCSPVSSMRRSGPEVVQRTLSSMTMLAGL